MHTFNSVRWDAELGHGRHPSSRLSLYFAIMIQREEVSTITMLNDFDLTHPDLINYARALRDFTVLPERLYLSHGNSVNSIGRENHSTEPPVFAPPEQRTA